MSFLSGVMTPSFPQCTSSLYKQIWAWSYRWRHRQASGKLSGSALGIACGRLLPNTRESWGQWGFTPWEGRKTRALRGAVPEHSAVAERVGEIQPIQTERRGHDGKTLLFTSQGMSVMWVVTSFIPSDITSIFPALSCKSADNPSLYGLVWSLQVSSASL